ncbi:hypothetical protein BOX15_Mlig001143g2 [Macrostomum lignano]|uniref:Uncharacterized protein n=1 Tax=Macrostomum lignano TaxID=282301 RepID=A0A267G449_9PLAT|nr:hypothetical protein BOX15_Mlig001143g2 [Macrostomum lignano]
MQAEELQKLYKEQDQILATIFDSKYGSDQEYRLEREHDFTCEKQQRISAAKARWQAARLLVQHAHSQLGYAVQRWDYICRIPAVNSQMRYGIATEVRNYLIAASTNLRNSQGYLKGIDFPYCKTDEVSTLERATNNIYGDMATTERHQHAMNVFRSTFQRSHALLQWFDVVIDKTIDRDLLMAIEELFAKKRELRIERVRLIREKLVELFGAEEAAAAGLDEADLQLDEDGNLTDARRLQEQLSKVNEEELKKQLENVKIVQPEKVQQSKEQEAAVEAAAAAADGDSKSADADEKAPKVEAVPLKELAPPPSEDQLFGDIDSIKKQYEIDMEEFQRAQDVNRARVEQGLQEKLAARKSRKARKMAQQEQTEKLLEESASA